MGENIEYARQRALAQQPVVFLVNIVHVAHIPFLELDRIVKTPFFNEVDRADDVIVRIIGKDALREFFVAGNVISLDPDEDIELVAEFSPDALDHVMIDRQLRRVHGNAGVLVRDQGRMVGEADLLEADPDRLSGVFLRFAGGVPA